MKGYKKFILDYLKFHCKHKSGSDFTASISYSGHGCKTGEWCLGPKRSDWLSFKELMTTFTENTKDMDEVKLIMWADCCFGGKWPI